MTQEHNGAAAKIYRFPVGGRAGARSRRDEREQTAAYAMQRYAKVACGGAWYHEEAIAQEESSGN
jgi:Protein of unknown function (DUF2735)